MKKLTSRQLIGLAVVILFAGARVISSFTQRQQEKERQELIQELSRMQVEERMEKSKKQSEEALNAVLEANKRNLDSLQVGLDSMRIKLEADKKRFEEQFGTEETP